MSMAIDLGLCPWQVESLHNKSRHFAMIGGVAIGKTFTGAHFAIYHIVHHPELTGFIGANTYDQLSQVTLRELFYWLDELGFQYVIDRRPPAAWRAKKRLKTYNNVLSIRSGKHVVMIFTRVLSFGNPLRGLEFSWYWIDETRDTPQNTHDIILSRLRESDYVKGLLTTTPAGEDWAWQRFVRDRKPGVFESVHVPTRMSVAYGIIPLDFYRDMRSSYSPAMAAQELDAQHINVLVGRSYYTADERNQERGYVPSFEYPLVIGMDFNYSPSPMVWVVGQLDETGTFVHWFDEISDVEVGTRDMARRLGYKYGDFFLRIFGDASGTRGTTSNAGDTDFNQIADELAELGVQYTIDTDQANPRVRDRVENVCRVLRDANGGSSMAVDPDRCPHLWQDLMKVKWSPSGKLTADNDELAQRTHGGDACGYACWKVLPPNTGQFEVGLNVESVHASLRAGLGR